MNSNQTCLALWVIENTKMAEQGLKDVSLMPQVEVGNYNPNIN
jgi:hypothetical protein